MMICQGKKNKISIFFKKPTSCSPVDWNGKLESRCMLADIFIKMNTRGQTAVVIS